MAIARWVEWATARRRLRVTSERCLARMLRRALGAAFSRLVQATREQRREAIVHVERTAMQQIEQKHQATGEEVQRACGAALPLAAFLKVGCPAAETHRGLARSLSLAASASARVRHHERPSFQSLRGS